jgi:hypothetical protein
VLLCFIVFSFLFFELPLYFAKSLPQHCQNTFFVISLHSYVFFLSFTMTWLKRLYLFHFLYMFYNCKRTWSFIVKLKMNWWMIWWEVNCKLLFHIVKNTTILHQYKPCYNFNLISKEINNLVKTRNTTWYSHFFMMLYKNQRWVQHFFASSS